MSEPSPMTDVLKRQFDAVHRMIEELVTGCPADAWRQADHPFFCPGRLLLHVIQATDYHIDPQPKQFDWIRFNIDWEEASPEQLPGAETVRAYLKEVDDKVAARLDELGDAGLVAKDWAGSFPTGLDHMIYTLRHAQHHVGQVNLELKQRGLKPARWR